MAQVFLQHLRLPQAQLCFKSPHCSVHVSDDTAPPLKLQVEHIQYPAALMNLSTILHLNGRLPKAAA
ncbi:unnamed protein product [Lota lota]